MGNIGCTVLMGAEIHQVQLWQEHSVNLSFAVLLTEYRMA
jgi:hypothetical protein